MMPKTKKINKKRTSNVIPIKKDVVDAENNDQLLSIEDQERERTNKFARKICDEIDEFVKECKMNSDMTYYHFLFHLKQRTILNVSYPLFQHANKASTNEVVENMSNYLNDNAPELKLVPNNNTIQ
jgi:citrate lyase alpha subunit